MKIKPGNTKLNLILLAGIVGLSILTISWHHQTYTLYKQIKQEKLKNHQIVALNKQLLTERSQAISGAEIKQSAIKNLHMKEVGAKDKGNWFDGNIKL